MTLRKIMIAGAVLISALVTAQSASAGAAVVKLAPAATADTAATNESVTLIKRRGGEFRGGKRIQGRKMYRHKYHHRRFHRRHGYKRRWRHRRYRHYGPSIIIAPYGYYGYYGYGSCYRRCRLYHGPRHCRRHWRRYCY